MTMLWQYFNVKYQNGNVSGKTVRSDTQAMSNMYLYQFTCSLSNDCSLITCADGRDSAVFRF